MSRFNEYFLMKTEDVIDYVRDKLNIFPDNAQLSCVEIGDGNLNYVFRVEDVETNKSIIVKQAGVTARISDEFKLSPDRNRIETEVLILQGELAPGLVPQVILLDNTMSCCVMEDLRDYTIMRQALISHEVFPKFADHITTFLANTLLLTSDVVMDHKEKKKLVVNYINPELCEISEDLVYTEPFNDINNRNELFEANKSWIIENIYKDDALRLEAAKLKFEFMTNTESLIHGDLHTGSIFINKESTKVIDPEFAFYGPMGYDIGNVIANLIFAWVNADATINDEHKKAEYKDWLEKTIISVIDLFSNKFLDLWKINVNDKLAKENGFDRWYLNRVIQDTAGVAGLELSRRIIGLAKVKDITSIEDINKRVKAERICLSVAKDYIKNRSDFREGNDFIQALNNAERLFK
ncbi:MAG: 5-methylthioribose kinase [Bacillales bacterium]|nr:5-methylthioribose kinase [Bacillales bacterium]